MSPRLRHHELVDKSRRPDDQQREELISVLQAAIATAVRARPRLEQAVRDLSGEFPSGGDGSASSEEADEDGPVTGSIVERRALEGMRADGRHAAEALGHLKETVSHILTLHDQVRRCLPVASASTALAGCKSCERLTDSQGNPTFSAQHRGELCSWCYDFDRLWKSWPPVELLDLHSRGIKISERRVKEALATPRKRPAV